MFIALVALSAPPPPPPPPDSFSLSPENRPLTAPPAGDLPSAFAVVARSAAEPIGLPLATPSSLSVTSDILSRTVPRASSPSVLSRSAPDSLSLFKGSVVAMTFTSPPGRRRTSVPQVSLRRSFWWLPQRPFSQGPSSWPQLSSPALPERAQAALRVPRVGLPPRSSLRPPRTRPRAPRLAALHPARTGPRAPLRPVRPPRTGPQSPPRRLRHQLPRTGPRALQRHPRTRPGPPCRRASSHRACVACRSACQFGSWPPRPPLPWPRRTLGREVRSVAPKAPDCSGRDRRPL